jgi:hypothetical protein
MNVKIKGMETTKKQTLILDWLALNCHGVIKDKAGFIFIKQPYTTRQFTDVHEIYYKNKYVGVTTSKPSSQIIPPQTIIVKFDNALLYSRSARYFIQKFLIETKLIYKSITRADIAYDFHTFEKELKPHQFIKDLFKMKYLKNGRGKFTTIGEQKRECEYSYLKYGSRSTGRTIYLYNKSLEMQQVKEKRHIREYWERNGLNTGRPVWRLEFSFKGNTTKIVDDITGEINKINWTDLFNIKTTQKIFNTAINQYFSFKINDNTKNKTRMADLTLLNTPATCIRLMKLPETEDPQRIYKTILRTLTADYYTNQKYTEEELRQLYLSIITIANRHHLNKFMKNTLKFQPAKLSHTY